MDNLSPITDAITFERLIDNIRTKYFLDPQSNQQFIFHKEHSFLVVNKELDEEVIFLLPCFNLIYFIYQ